MKNLCIVFIAIIIAAAKAQFMMPEWDFPSTLTRSAPPERLLQGGLCNGLFRGNNNECTDTCDDYQDQLDAFQVNPISNCVCDPCSSRFDIALNCDFCQACQDGVDVCLDMDVSSGWSIVNETTLAHVRNIIRVTTTGADSASNTLVLEFGRKDGQNDPNDCRVTLDGAVCQDCSRYFDTECSALDCSNVPNGAHWTCEDRDEIIANTSHPLYGLTMFLPICVPVTGPI